jgi:hypothetical protein
MEITCNLYSQWIAAIRQEMTDAGFDHSGLTDQACAVTWQAWRRRIVPAGARAIQRAAAFVCPPNLQQGLANFERAVASGTDVWPWQSRFIDRPAYEDGLFNEYRITHFHLGVGFLPNGYIIRTPALLFAIVDASSVYEIGIYQHGDWYELDILDIIDDNWPQLLERFTVHGIQDVQCPRTRDEVRTLRTNNMMSMIRLRSGRIIAPPGGGFATDGTSVEAVTHADYFAGLLRYGEQSIPSLINQQVDAGLMPDREYIIHLNASDEEISADDGIGYRWILWRKPNAAT